jgi:hypothetical protein
MNIGPQRPDIRRIQETIESEAQFADAFSATLQRLVRRISKLDISVEQMIEDQLENRVRHPRNIQESTRTVRRFRSIIAATRPSISVAEIIGPANRRWITSRSADASTVSASVF